LTYKLELYDSTGELCGYAVKSDSGDEFLIYDKHGKLVARVSSKTTADQAIKIILGSLWYLC